MIQHNKAELVIGQEKVMKTKVSIATLIITTLMISSPLHAETISDQSRISEQSMIWAGLDKVLLPVIDPASK